MCQDQTVSDIEASQWVQCLVELVVPYSWSFFIGFLALWACLFFHTNVNNNLALIVNVIQLFDARLRKHFRGSEVHLH